MLLEIIDAGEDIFSSHYDLTSFVFGLNQCDMSVPPACKMGFSRMSPTTGILCVSNKVMRHHLKSGYTGFAWLESSADATPAVMLSPAVAMAVEVQCRRPPARAQCLHISTMSNHQPMQTRHNLVGEIRIFSVKICINPYPSLMHRCIAKTFTRFISHAVCKKIATCNKKRQPAAKNQNRSFTSRGATVRLGLRLDAQSCSTGNEISGFSEI